MTIAGRYRRRAQRHAVATFKTQGQAWEKAKAIARRERSEAVLHGKDGRIRERNTYGADPRSSKG